MADPHVVTGLIAKRAELTGQIEHTQNVLRQLVIDLDNLDAVLRLFKPGIDLAEVRPRPFPPRHAAFRGEISRIVLSALRASSKPLTTHDLAMHVMAERGLDTADLRLVRLIGKRVGSCLRSYRERGIVRSERGPEQFMVWQIAK